MLKERGGHDVAVAVSSEILKDLIDSVVTEIETFTFFPAQNQQLETAAAAEEAPDLGPLHWSLHDALQSLEPKAVVDRSQVYSETSQIRSVYICLDGTNVLSAQLCDPTVQGLRAKKFGQLRLPCIAQRSLSPCSRVRTHPPSGASSPSWRHFRGTIFQDILAYSEDARR